MLRALFGDPPRVWEGVSLETVREIERFVKLADGAAQRKRGKTAFYIKAGILAEGLLSSFDELEQSCYAAVRYAGLISNNLIDELTSDERLSYARHIYFDKNAYIRVFALLDKLGVLLNALLNLRTERIKVQFSYYTVLRNMREHRLYPQLMLPLNELKERHQETMNRLRDRRNMEIHLMNAELEDDLRQTLLQHGVRRTLENLVANMADLDNGWQMARGSLLLSFRFACGRLERDE